MEITKLMANLTKKPDKKAKNIQNNIPDLFSGLKGILTQKDTSSGNNVSESL